MFTRHNQTTDQFEGAQRETLSIPLPKNTHMMRNIRRVVRRKRSPSFWGGLFGTSYNFTIAETTILSPIPYDLFPQPNNTASLLLLQGGDTGGFYTISDIQDPTLWTVLSNIGGMLSIGGVILSVLFGLEYAALLGLEGFSLFPSRSKSTQAREDEERQMGRAGASAADGGDGDSDGGLRQRNGRDTEDENTIFLLPLSRHRTV
ncbi:hypothetical protein BOTBODRAFT_39748 [Botryobasidium botryosum FD-172 SS1]|uniref:Uncharacterized protein n=1 Tax=Botryobasidium botryosum (strain FD-172 SS1) TaxID=930990 RepID=A0A067LT19_BOTB1|nr:hypothetical protein BOTBODRAFT_39748 [Botryobasidium botryosum FD-172 SS1]